MPRNRTSLLSSLTALGVGAALVLTGCGRTEPQVASVPNSVSTSATDNGGVEAGASQAKVAADLKPYLDCMRKQGIEMPEPSAGGQLIELTPNDDPAAKAAQEACKQYLPAAAELPAEDPTFAQAMRDHAKCMRTNGVKNYPDPDPGGATVLENVDVNDPAYQKATKTCEAVLAGAGVKVVTGSAGSQ